MKVKVRHREFQIRFKVDSAALTRCGIPSRISHFCSSITGCERQKCRSFLTFRQASKAQEEFWSSSFGGRDRIPKPMSSHGIFCGSLNGWSQKMMGNSSRSFHPLESKLHPFSGARFFFWGRTVYTDTLA